MVNPALRLVQAIRSALGLEVPEAVRARSDASLWFESLERRVLLSADLSGVAGIAHLHAEAHAQPAPIVRLSSSADGVVSKPLSIDPTPGYSTYLGGSGNESIDEIRTDSQGNTYVLGQTTSNNLSGSGSSTSTYLLPTAFWAKYDAEGKQVWLHEVATPATPGHLYISVDDGIQIAADGTPYVLYSLEDTPDLTASSPSNFPSVGTLHLVTLGPDGSPVTDRVLLQGTSSVATGGVYDVSGTGLAMGPDGNLYVGAVQYSVSGISGSVIKVNPATGVLFQATLPAPAEALAVDAAGDMYVAFSTADNTLPGSSGVRSANREDSDIYLMELSADGQNQLFGTYLGGPGNEYLGGMVLNPSEPGRVYISGTTTSDFLRTPDHGVSGGRHVIPTPGPASDGFIIEVDVARDTLVAGTFLGGGDQDGLTGIAVDSAGDVYVSGQSNSSDFPTANPVQARYAAGAPVTDFTNTYDYVIAELDPTLNSLLFSTYYGGTGQDSGEESDNALAGAYGGPKIAVDASGTIHVAGPTSSTDFPTLKCRAVKLRRRRTQRHFQCHHLPALGRRLVDADAARRRAGSRCAGYTGAAGFWRRRHFRKRPV